MRGNRDLRQIRSQQQKSYVSCTRRCHMNTTSDVKSIYMAHHTERRTQFAGYETPPYYSVKQFNLTTPRTSILLVSTINGINLLWSPATEPHGLLRTVLHVKMFTVIFDMM